MERLKDENGKESSRRVLGFRLSNLGIAMGMSYFALGIIFAIVAMLTEKESRIKLSDVYEFPYMIFWGFLGSGLSALGMTLIKPTKK